MCKISVIIPIYNVEPYLKRCLDSVVNQTLSDIEIILINDCSTDNSLEIAQSYTQKDKRIILIDLPINQGAAAARNKGLEVASGEYLGFVDPDDAIDLNFYEELYKKAKETDADIIKGNLILFNLDGTTTLSTLNEKITKNGRFEFSYEWPSAIYKHSFVKDNNIIIPEDTNNGEDVVFLYRCLLKTEKLELLNSVNYYYLRREGSLYSEKMPPYKITNTIKSLSYILDDFDKELEINLSNKDYVLQYYKIIINVLEYIRKKCEDKTSKLECINKSIAFYNRCKRKDELDMKLTKWVPLVFDMIKSNDIEGIYQIYTKYNNGQEYFIATLKANIKKDLTNV